MARMEKNLCRNARDGGKSLLGEESLAKQHFRKPVGIFSAQNKTSATKSKQRSLGLFWFVKEIVLVRKSFD